MTDQTYNVIVVFQEADWQDDGGDHDPIARTVDQKTLQKLQNMASTPCVNTSDVWELGKELTSSPEPQFPCTIHQMFNIWHTHKG